MVKGLHMEKINETEIVELINNVNNHNCNDSFLKLSNLYEKFYFKVVSKYYPALYKVELSKEDISAEKELALLKAIRTFNAKQKTKFSTWFCNTTKYHFLNLINANKKLISHPKVPIDEFINSDLVFSYDKNNDTFNYLMSILSSFKDSRIKKIYELRYFSDSKKLTTWNDIGRKLGISTQTAINLHEKTRSFLKNKFFDLV